MTKTVLREAILPRIDGIQKNLKRLKDLAKLSCEEFSFGDSYDLAQHHSQKETNHNSQKS